MFGVMRVCVRRVRWACICVYAIVYCVYIIWYRYVCMECSHAKIITISGAAVLCLNTLTPQDHSAILIALHGVF